MMTTNDHHNVTTAGTATPNGSVEDENKPDNWKMISQGAEARIWYISEYNSSKSPAICKERFAKNYRHPVLDQRLTKSRCKAEAKILQKLFAKRNNHEVDAPQVYEIRESSLYLEFIEGRTVRSILNELLLQEGRLVPEQICEIGRGVGSVLGKLHARHGLVHGDLTTSNLMIRQKYLLVQPEESSRLLQRCDASILPITMIDFGLAKHSESAEERAVDWYVLERALQATHATINDYGFSLVEVMWEAYQAEYPSPTQAQAVYQRLEQVRLRGRKRECFG
jgi:TP53 regulating kinase and related kinases